MRDRIHVALWRMFHEHRIQPSATLTLGIDFDHLFDMIGQALKTENANQYPPYNIAGEDAYRVTLALAGWTTSEIAVTRSNPRPHADHTLQSPLYCRAGWPRVAAIQLVYRTSLSSDPPRD